jgi:hypothetical protein
MPPSVYIETSIVSYFVARPSRDAVMAARQRQTRDWWVKRRAGYLLFTSELVAGEVVRGEQEMARRSIAKVCRGRGFEPPILCTPEDLMRR